MKRIKSDVKNRHLNHSDKYSKVRRIISAFLQNQKNAFTAVFF